MLVILDEVGEVKNPPNIPSCQERIEYNWGSCLEKKSGSLE